MINPLRAIYLNNKFYRYVSEVYHEDIEFKNSSVEAQNGRNFSSLLGTTPEKFAVSFMLENQTVVQVGESVVGTTTWLGVSRLADLKSYISGKGASMPLIFVNPYGATFLVVPTGTMGIDIFNDTNPQSQSAEFRVTLTLESQ